MQLLSKLVAMTMALVGLGAMLEPGTARATDEPIVVVIGPTDEVAQAMLDNDLEPCRVVESAKKYHEEVTGQVPSFVLRGHLKFCWDGTNVTEVEDKRYEVTPVIPLYREGGSTSSHNVVPTSEFTFYFKVQVRFCVVNNCDEELERYPWTRITVRGDGSQTITAGEDDSMW